MPHLAIGVDVSKDILDIFRPDDGTHRRLDNRPDAIVAWLATLPGDALVVFEATGVYDRALRNALADAGQPATRVNPLRARQFAQATGFQAKTDRVDARMLSHLGETIALRRCAPVNPARQHLADLVLRRDQLVETRKQEKIRRKQTANPAIRNGLDRHLAFLTAEIDAVEADIHRQIESDDTLAATARRLRQVPGVGPVVAAVLLAGLPELGQIDRRAVAALAGLAPLAADSGQYRGRRKIIGGRRHVRRALYQAAVTARRNTPFGAAYNRLVKAGKPPKVAMIATARKILVTLNAIVRDNSAYTPNPAA